MTDTLTMPKQRHSATEARRGELTLDIVRDEQGFHALQPFWDALLEQTATRTPFMRWDWVSLWWEECRGDAQLAIGVLRDVEGLPQAIAPLMFAHENDRVRQHLTTLGFLGGFGDAHGECFDLIVPEGREGMLTPQLCRVFALLRHECDNVRLNHLPEESPNSPYIMAALQEHFIRAEVLNRHAGQHVSLPASWHEFELLHSANWRSNMRRSWKKLIGQHAGIPSLAGDRVSHQQALEELYRLHALNFPAGVSTFTTPAAVRFHQRLAARWLREKRAILPLLEADDRVVAVMYGFVERGRFFHYQMGWDSTQAELAPGKLVTRWCFETAITMRLQVYDMLPGEHEYKQRWCGSTHWVLDLEAHNPVSWRATAFHALRVVSRRLTQGGLAA